MSKVELVKNAMLAVQRYPWEQGVCMQALYELGDIKTAIAMANDAVLRQKEDGRLAVINENIAVTDPAANGEVVLHAYEITGDEKYKVAATKMYHYLMDAAPRTDKGILCHNEISFQEGYSKNQIWVDSIYMAPPFLAVMGNVKEAVRQIVGIYDYLIDDKTGLLSHIYDAGNNVFLRKKLWATGNGWALLGMARVIDESIAQNKREEIDELICKFENLLMSMTKYQREDGRFYDILDDKESFVDGTSAMMMAAAVYRGVLAGWLDGKYIANADIVYNNMDEHIDEYGLIHDVCGCPDFISSGTSAESMAAYLMMHAFYNKLNRGREN